MVSTRQMTGATSEESSLQLFRAIPSSSSSTSSVSTSTSAAAGVGTIISSTSNRTATAAPQHISQSSPASISEVSLPPLASGSGNSFSNVGLPVSVLGSAGAATNGEQIQQRSPKINLMDLPTEILGHIFSFVGYKKIAHMRVISRQMNQVCSAILNSTFQKLQNQMHTRFQTVKAKMPRRESARRNHPLACECDILETCYMRLSLLQMTFGKHIERKHCCFFPGGILDEVYSVLNYIRTSTSLDRPFKVTDELFDLSTMAMEYFKEHIEPILPDIAYFTNSTKSFVPLETSSSILSRDTSHSNSSSPPQSNMVLRKGIRKIKQGMKRYNNQLTVLRSELRTCKRKATEQAKTITEQQKLLAEQQKQTLEFANRLDETDKKNDELSRKFSTVLQELNKCKTELQYWRSKSPATTDCNAPYDPETLANQSETPEDIDIFSVSMARGTPVGHAIAEGNRKREEFGQIKERVDQNLQALLEEGEPPVLVECAERTALTVKPGLKRKFECVVAGDSCDNSSGGASESGPTRLDELACLNPPFASASLVASYSSSSPSPPLTVSTVPSSPGDGNQLAVASVVFPPAEDLEAIHSMDSSTGVGCEAVDSSDATPTIKTPQDERTSTLNIPIASPHPFCGTPKAIQVLHAVHGLTQNSSSSFSRTVDSKNDSTSNDNNTNHNKKLRRVQNKARSQNNNKHTNQSTLTNTHTKTTRSK